VDIFLKFKDVAGGYHFVRKSDVCCVVNGADGFLSIYLKGGACCLSYLNTLNTLDECETIINETN